MPKPTLMEPFRTLERDIIESMMASFKEWRPDLDYPASYSDMEAAVRGLLRMFEVKRRPLGIVLPTEDEDEGMNYTASAMHAFHQLARKEPKSDDEKALLAAIMLLSTQHDPRAESRSFSHLTPEGCYDKLLTQWGEMKR